MNHEPWIMDPIACYELLDILSQIRSFGHPEIMRFYAFVANQLAEEDGTTHTMKAPVETPTQATKLLLRLPNLLKESINPHLLEDSPFMPLISALLSDIDKMKKQQPNYIPEQELEEDVEITEEILEKVQEFLSSPYVHTIFIMKEVDENVYYGEYNPSKRTSRCFLAAAGMPGMKPGPQGRIAAFGEWLANQMVFYVNKVENHQGQNAVSLSRLKNMVGPMNSLAEWLEGEDVVAGIDTDEAFGLVINVENAEFSDPEIHQIYTAITVAENLLECTLGGKEGEISLHKELKVVIKNSKVINRASDARYDLGLLNVNKDVAVLADKIQEQMNLPEVSAISMLLEGPPGTGKTKYAERLADMLGRPLIKKTYAELQNMYVGQGEKELHMAFHEAKERQAVLLIDEVDSLAANRESAERQYMVSYVNQFLAELDNLEDCVFVATTNRMKALDPAFLRRFPLKIKFSFMTPAQVNSCFNLYFPEFKGEVLDLNSKILTPADFDTVRNTLKFEPGIPTIQRVRELLQEEIKIKKETLSEALSLESKVGYEL